MTVNTTKTPACDGTLTIRRHGKEETFLCPVEGFHRCHEFNIGAIDGTGFETVRVEWTQIYPMTYEVYWVEI